MHLSQKKALIINEAVLSPKITKPMHNNDFLYEASAFFYSLVCYTSFSKAIHTL